MPDGGMWDMSMLVKEKHCTGHKGVWACEEDYPDHILPIEEFQKNQSMCKRCSRMRLSKENPKNNPIRSISYGIAGGFDKYYSLPKEDRISIRAEAKLAHLLNTALAEEVLPFIQSRKSEFGQSIPMTRRETVHVEGEKVDEGWVYVFKCYTSLENHPWVRSVYKIGKTYPDGIGGRMSTARGFARVDFIDKFWFEEAEVSEKEVHTILEPFNLRTLGYTNCGKEMFMCSLEQAVSAINEVEKKIGNTKEQAVG